MNASLQEDFRSGRHTGGVNMAYADGHVKWIKSEQVIQEARKPAPARNGAWNPANQQHVRLREKSPRRKWVRMGAGGARRGSESLPLTREARPWRIRDAVSSQAICSERLGRRPRPLKHDPPGRASRIGGERP